MFRSLLLLAVPLASAGTVAGHPVTTGFAPGSGLVYTGGALPISTLTVDHCDGTFETVAVDATIDPVAHDPIGLPEGYVCALTITLSSGGVVALDGYASANANTFALDLTGVGAIEITVDPAVYVPDAGLPGGPTGIRFGDVNWITASGLGLVNGSVTIDDQHTLHDTLRDAIRDDSLMW